MTGDEKKEIREDFRRAVNMTHKELEDWLQIEESRSVGWTREGGERGRRPSVGPADHPAQAQEDG